LYIVIIKRMEELRGDLNYVLGEVEDLRTTLGCIDIDDLDTDIGVAHSRLDELDEKVDGLVKEIQALRNSVCSLLQDKNDELISELEKMKMDIQ